MILLVANKPRICKCGHLKNEHYDIKPKEKYSTGQCSKCKCSKYLSRKLPNFSSKIMLGYGICMIMLAVFIPLWLYFATPIGTHWNDKAVPIGSVMVCLFGLFAVCAIEIFQRCIVRYFYEKRRKDFPVEN